MAQNDLLIGFDLGTSAAKAILTDTHGRIVSRASRAVSYLHPEPDRCEFDSDEYFENVVDIIKELVDDAPDPHAIRAMSFSGASGNALLLDEKYRPLTRTISWNDRRTVGRAAELWPELDADEIHRRAGWPWNGTMPLAHLAWYRDNMPELWEKAGFYAMNSDYMYHKLSGRLVLDPSKATTFYLQDQSTGKWNQGLLDFLGIDESSLATILPSGAVVGPIVPELCDATGLSPETKIVTGSFDHPSAARSTGVFEEGDLLISAGTSWVTFAPVQDRQVGLDNGMLIDPFLSPGGCYGVMFALTSVAEKIDVLLKQRFGDGDDLYKRFDLTAIESPPGARGLLLDPWQMSPEEIADGSRDVDDDVFSRALMEGCAFLLKNRIEKLRGALSTEVRRIVMVGGPTKSPIWPGILAAIIGAPIHIPESGPHAGALGAAILAGIGAGIFSDVREGWQCVKTDERVESPDVDQVKNYQTSYRDFCSLFTL